MSAEREVLVSLLKLTKGGTAEVGEISKDARIPARITRQALKKSSDLGMILLQGNFVTVSAEQRLRTAVRVAELGADIERVCQLLTWEEFEDMSILAFEALDFEVKKHFRFSLSGKRWEIDVLGLKEPIVASVDCKQWHRGWRGSASRKAAERQIERTKALAEASIFMKQKLGIEGWKRADLVPMILSLTPGVSKFQAGAPVVPVLQLLDFLQDLPAYIDMVTHFHVSFGDLEKSSHAHEIYGEKDVNSVHK